MKFLKRLLNGHHHPELDALKEEYSASLERRRAATQKLTKTAEGIIRRLKEQEMAEQIATFQDKGAI